jgi:hypothetical protein
MRPEQPPETDILWEMRTAGAPQIKALDQYIAARFSRVGGQIYLTSIRKIMVLPATPSELPLSRGEVRVCCLAGNPGGLATAMTKILLV